VILLLDWVSIWQQSIANESGFKPKKPRKAVGVVVLLVFIVGQVSGPGRPRDENVQPGKS
jgi:hypothetical protein